jgi:hypothetical protein
MDDQALSDAAPVEDKPSSQQDELGLFLMLKEQIIADMEHSNTWRTNALQEFNFVAGPGQWNQTDVQKLVDEQRPAVTFNKTLKFVRAICGIEANNRHKTAFLPTDITDPGDIKENEVLSGTSDWMARGCNADRKQSRAFRDATICGMGFTEAKIDFDQDPKGKYIEDRVFPGEMGWDKNARDDNLLDAKRIWRARKMLLSEARALLPGITDSPDVMDEDLNASWAGDITSGKDPNPKTQEQKELRAENNVSNDPKREVTIVQVQWSELEGYYKTVRPDAQAVIQQAAMAQQQVKPEDLLIDVSETDWPAHVAKMGGQTPPSAKLRRKVYKQAFLGSKILQCGPGPRPDGFTFNVITYEPDDVEGTWFGIVRVLKDPQIWSNKFFAQIMHIVNSTAKGGILVEKSAMDDAREFLANYAKPNAVTVLADGAIAKGKIMAKPGAGITAGVMQLFQIADGSFGTTSGVNLELLGAADRDQPGVLEAQRKQAAMTILASLFDNFALFKQQVGQTRLCYIQKYLATDTPRMIRINGDNGWKAIPLIRRDVMGQYDTEVSEAPSSPNTKEKVWAALMQVLPAFKDMLTPEVAVTILDYAPGLPSKLVDALRQISQKPDPDAEKHKMLAITSAVEDIKNKRADTEQKEASADASRAGAVLDIAKIGVQQAEYQVGAYRQVLDAIGAEKDRAMAASEGDALSPGTAGPKPPAELPELGEMQPPAQDMPAMIPPAAPGGLVPPGGLGM